MRKSIDQKVFALLILGMHRSGTSITADWLHQCGLDLGKKFLEADVGNIKGYNEDEEFVKFHKKILRKNDLEDDINIIKQPTVDNEDIRLGETLIETRFKMAKVFGWKDPRTCLFLDFWKDILPSYKSLVIYRNYNEVVDSLVRRKAKAEKKRRNVILGHYNYLTRKKYSKASYTNMILRSWIIHNQGILKFLKSENPNNYLVFSIDQILNEDESVFNLMESNFKLNLNYYPFKNIFDETLMKRDRVNYTFDPVLIETANKIISDYKQLNSLDHR